METCEGKWQYQVFLWQQLTPNFEIACSSSSVSSFTILLLPSHAGFKKPYHLQVLITGRSREIKAVTWVPTEMRISAGNFWSLWGEKHSPVQCCKPEPRRHQGYTGDTRCLPQAVVCWECSRWPTRFVYSQRAYCVLCSGRACVSAPGREAVCLPCAGCAGACQRTRIWHLPRGLSVSGESLCSPTVRRRRRFLCRLRCKPAVRVETETPEGIVSQSSFLEK